jgi:muramidase (phage lysozyme)
MSREKLEEHLKNPNVKAFLDLISMAEGTYYYPNRGYNTSYGGGQFEGLADHPTSSGAHTASGRYQFLSPTWRGLVRNEKFEDFSEHNQDLGAVQLIIEGGAMKDVLAGNFGAAAATLGGNKKWTGFNKFDVADGLKRLRDNPYYQKTGFDFSKINGMPPEDHRFRGEPLANEDRENPAYPRRPIPPVKLAAPERRDPFADQPLLRALGLHFAETAGRSSLRTEGVAPGLSFSPAPASGLGVAGVAGRAVPETAEDDAVLEELRDFDPAARGVALAMRQLYKNPEENLFSPRKKYPTINDRDFLNTLDGISLTDDDLKV